MRKKTGIRTIIFALLLILGGFSVIATGTASGDQFGDYTYTLNGGQATIIDYTGTGGAISIPSFFGTPPIVYPVVAIGDNAFSSTTGNLVTSVVIPSSVTSIGNYAFFGCTLLTTFTIPSSVTSVGTGAFNLCSSLDQIIVAVNNPSYTSLDGILYDKAVTTAIQCPMAKTGAVVLPTTVTSILGQSFYDCTEIGRAHV